MNITDFFCDQFSVVLLLLLLFYLMLVGWLLEKKLVVSLSLILSDKAEY